MKQLLVFTCFIIYSISFSQIEQGKYYHYRTDHFYDTLLNKASWDEFIFLKNDSIYKAKIQNKATIDENYEYRLTSNYLDPLPKPKYDGLGETYVPYSTFINGETVFIKFFHHYSNKDTIVPMYPLNVKDTIKFAFNQRYLNDRENSDKWLPSKGYMTYLHDTTIKVLNQYFDCYVFKNVDRTIVVDRRLHDSRTIFLDKKSLIMVQSITNFYPSDGDELLKYHLVQYLDSTSITPPLFSTEEELQIFYDWSKKWTRNQKNEFIRVYSSWASKEDCECAMNKIDGTEGFFNAVLPNPDNESEFRFLINMLEECQEK